jgi:hypothetical protein
MIEVPASSRVIAASDDFVDDANGPPAAKPVFISNWEK